MLMPKKLSRSSKTENQDGKTIRFDLKSDNEIRNIAKAAYEIAKKMKDVGLRFKKVIPAIGDLSVRKLFKLPIDSKLICLEIDVSGKSETDKSLLIEDIKNNFLLLDNLKLIDEKLYVYDKLNTVYRFLIKFELPTPLK